MVLRWPQSLEQMSQELQISLSCTGLRDEPALLRFACVPFTFAKCEKVFYGGKTARCYPFPGRRLRVVGSYSLHCSN
jgi:hypothetical protein